MTKGRNKDLIIRRNRKLIERYYYWTEVKRRRFDDVMQILSKDEFFITEFTIQIILNENHALLNEVASGKKLFTPIQII